MFIAILTTVLLPGISARVNLPKNRENSKTFSIISNRLLPKGLWKLNQREWYHHNGIDCMILLCQGRVLDSYAVYSCLSVKEFLAQSRCDIWSLTECNGNQTHNHLVHKRTLSHLSKPVKWLSCFVRTYLYGVFDFAPLSCHVAF